MRPTAFTEVARFENAQGPEDQALQANAGGDPTRSDTDSPERMPPEKVQRFSSELSLAEAVRGWLADTAGGDSLLPIAGSLPKELAPVGTDFSQIPGSSTTFELRQQVARTVISGNLHPPSKLGLRQQLANLKGALHEAGHRTQEEVAYTKYALYSEFENAVHQYEDEA